MKWFLAALGLLMVAAGGYWAFTGSLIVQVERGWSAVIAGSVVFSTGLLMLALSALMGSVDRLAKAMLEAQGAAPRPVAARPQAAAAPTVVASPVAAPSFEEPDDKSQLKLELLPAPVPVEAAFTPVNAPVTVVTKPAPVEVLAEPDAPPVVSMPQVEQNAPVRIAEPPAASDPALDNSPPQAKKPAQNPAGRPMMPRPAPPTPAGRPVPPPPPAARVRPIHPSLAPPPPPPTPPPAAAPMAQAQAPSGAVRSEEPPVPAPRPAGEPRKVGWLERALEEKAPGEAALNSTTAPIAPTPPASSVAQATAELTERGKREAPRAPDMTGDEAPEMKVPRSEATPIASRAQARVAETAVAETAVAETPVAETPAVQTPTPGDRTIEPQPRPDANPPPEPVRLPVARSDDFDKATPTRRIPEPPPIADLPKIMRKYESQGVSYTLYEDGSIDADSSAGRFHFASLDELRAFLEPKS